MPAVSHPDWVAFLVKHRFLWFLRGRLTLIFFKKQSKPAYLVIVRKFFNYHRVSGRRHFLIESLRQCRLNFSASISN
jgi:hypothetical protein